MIKYVSKNTHGKKIEEKKQKELNSFAKEQFYALKKMNVGISIRLYQL